MHLAVEQHVAASTHHHDLNALFLYREVLGIDVAGALHAVRAKRPRRLPTVLTPADVHAVLRALSGTHLLMAQLLYGSGMGLMERVRLRVNDVDVAQQQLIVREGKGQQGRVMILPARIQPALHDHLQIVKWLHAANMAR